MNNRLRAEEMRRLAEEKLDIIYFLQTCMSVVCIILINFEDVAQHFENSTNFPFSY